MELNCCEACKHWVSYELEFPNGLSIEKKKEGGYCHNSKLTEDWGEYGEDMLVYPYNEGVEHFWVGKKFGCVHHESKRT